MIGFDISSLPNDLQEGAREFLKEREISTVGMPVVAEKGNCLCVSSDGESVRIVYDKKCEFFRGLQKAITRAGQTYSLTEKCAYRKFGYMPDLSRNGVLTMNALKKSVRMIAAMGYDNMQLYTEDVYEVNSEPYFGYLRGGYSKKELKEIVAYGKLFGVELVPCIQTLGHLSRLFRWTRFYEVCEGYDVLFPGEEQTKELLERMFASLRECYDTDTVHVGMDEAPSLGRCGYWDKHGEQKQRLDVFVKHLNDVNEIAGKYGFHKVMMWSDMFIKIEEDDEVACGKKLVRESVRRLVPENVTIVRWTYQINKNEDLLLESHKSFNRNLCYAGGVQRHAFFAPNNQKAQTILDFQIAKTKAHGIEEFMITSWGDGGSTGSFFANMPPLYDSAELAYGNDPKNEEAGFETVFGVEKSVLYAMDKTEVCPRAPEVFNRNGAQLYAHAFRNVFNSHIKEEDGDRFAALAKEYTALEKKAGEWKYLLEFQAALCELLSHKFTLSVKTKRLYDEKDKAGLEKLLETSWKQLPELYEKALGKLRVQWMKECKPHGFDVIELRFGGLIFHTRDAISQLEEYVRGERVRVDELEYELLSNVQNPEKDYGPIGEWEFKNIYSTYKV